MIDTGITKKVLREYNFKAKFIQIFLKLENLFWRYFPYNYFNLKLFLIIYPYNFVPLTAQIKLEIYYLNELENRCSQEVNLMALNDTFSIQDIKLDKKNLLYGINPKGLEPYWNKECAEHPSNNHCKIFCD